MRDVFSRHCEQCGAEIPRMANSLRIFCSRKCGNAYHHGLLVQARREARQGRTCGQCGGPIPEAMRGGVKWCSRKCRNDYHNGRAKG